ncbi:phosphonate C-P lyase system protein PhnG [Mycolicibacterium phlei]|jgi:alpha-D-ribose 1-methylphosphonate 5-triphosphate synthase subunit PhnG|uniref:Phosphonate metabolism PhnG family protein n=1 Tax=Mycolicibacterium phlei DSM 43239 = CCUG 21000 TaxID=1226750 RepID=A0A5N5V3A3_MYCPH|nr:phosphonate C-P lyase system protein PhnG [Mycolicibacterium phlei]VEG09188.1 phosphonate C-P lyase system protein PhnG [Mycobacteroides chelonae]AMO61072.1 Phosphonate metabolism protein PhnG [Mycolicibacterium phlei]KAB7754990.1 phosphonate metabolism PhnG family protein [Mycolicibacterium phlei DSM 43239 = CCUG 21000]KXW64046.1 phosphonate metabolism PhnG family protein [Mycolicibacterium phlei DSM 43239 = CCUG 21000]KXW66892.1 phosphonate metabolism PhnG family protein [Mycolicibacteriu
MTPEDRFAALAAADTHALEELADAILACGPDVRVIAGPEAVSAPVRLPVPDGSTTVIGHVALTRCTVTLDGQRGDGIRTGYDLTGAVAAAVCDAEYERAGAFSLRVDDLCRTARTAAEKTRRRRATLVAATTLDEA